MLTYAIVNKGKISHLKAWVINKEMLLLSFYGQGIILNKACLVIVLIIQMITINAKATITKILILYESRLTREQTAKTTEVDIIKSIFLP
jgi:hypothetical protein